MLSTIGFQLSTAPAHAQGTSFTYQGRLSSGAASANGTYDFQFTLFDVAIGGLPLEEVAVLTNAAVVVSEGLFTTTLDFGNQFLGADRWLQIGVRTNGGDTFATLSPRQPLTPTPYAMYANAASNVLGTVNATQLSGNIPAANISGTIPLAQLPSGLLTNGASAVTLNGTFMGDGAGVTNVFVTNLVTFQSPVVAWGGAGLGETNITVGLSNVVDVAGGGSHSLALKGDGTVVASGFNFFGQTDIPMGLSNVTAIAAGYYHSLALKSDGTVVAWGYNSNGQTNIPVGLSNVTAIAAGYVHSLALKSDGTVVGWGGDEFSQFGQTNIPPDLSNVVAISTRHVHGLALKGDGTVVAWGSYGGTNVPAGLSNVVAIAAGDSHSLALKSDGTVWAWGDDTYGQTDIPAGLGTVVAIAAGSEHCLALKSDGTVIAWGRHDFGQTNIPVGLVNVTKIAAGSGHNLALRVAGLTTAQIALLNANNTFQGAVTAASFAGNGGGLTALNANNLTAGTVSDERLSFNVALRAGGNEFTGTQLINGGNVGIGTLSPFAKLHVIGNVLANGSVTATNFVGNGTGLTNLIASSLASGTVALARLPATVLTNGASGVNLTGTFTGNGGGLTDLNTANLTGTLPEAQLPPSVVTNGASDVNLIGTFTGNGGGLTNLSASNLASGTIALTQLPPAVLTNGASGVILSGTFTGNGAGLTNVLNSTAANYVYAFDTNTQTVAVTNTFQDITFDTAAQINGWMHTAATASFTNTQSGLYLIDFTAETETTTGGGGGGNATTVSIRAVLNGAEIPGSQAASGPRFANQPFPISKSFIANISASDVLKIQFTGTTTNNRLISNSGTGTTKPSVSMTIIRIQ